MIYLIRHGQTEWNAEGRIQGSKDSPLTKIGISQVHKVALKLKSSGLNNPVIVSSPLERALKSAQVIKDDLKITQEILINKDIAEKNHGKWEGLKQNAIPKDEKLVYEANKLLNAPHGGESNFDLICRVGRFKKSLEIFTKISNQVQDVLIVSHQTSNQILLAVLTTTPYELSYKMKNDDLISIDPLSLKFNII